MKNTIILLLSILQVGCSLFPSKFDSTLYNNIITLSADVKKAETKCGSADEIALVYAINDESKHLVAYTTYVSRDLHSSLVLADKAITELNNVYAVGKPSLPYCKLKLEIIDLDLQEILKGAGDKN